MFTNKEEIALGVKDELTKSMTGFGYAIIQARLPTAACSGLVLAA